MPEPGLMTAIGLAGYGGPDVLQPQPRPIPQPGPGEVLLRVTAAGVNRPDVMQRQGLYPPPPGASDIPGLEVAGRIVALGDAVSAWALGDSVCALLTGGGYAEYCVAAADLCLPIPAGLNALQAASLPETYFTVWANLMQRGRLAAGESLLVHGGAGGIGVAALQLARAFGVHTYTTVGSHAKQAFCAGLGASAIHYREQDFVAAIQTASGGRGVDVILDIIGGDYLQRNLACLAVEGRLLQIAFQNGPKTQINLAPVLLKRLTLTGSTLRPRSVADKAVIAAALRTQVWPLLESAKINAIVHAVLPLNEAAAAHRLLESSAHIGKIVLAVDAAACARLA